jgi:biopolymer transport protein ExbD
MKLWRTSRTGYAKGDMTPMIDMTFQLIAFFMVVINFTEVEQNERIRLPASELAKPPDAPLQSPITIQVTKQDTVIFGGEEMAVTGLRRLLLIERQVIEEPPGRRPSDATIVIRGDQDAETGKIQEVIRVCQEMGFEKFVLRARQEEGI